MNVLEKKLMPFLLWMQKYTKADMLYIARGGFWIFFSQSINSTLTLILIVAFANLVPKETYGMYTYILSIAGMLNFFTFTGMNSAVVRTVAVGGDGILTEVVRYQLKWNSVLLLIFLLMSGYYFSMGNTVMGLAFLVLGLFVPATLALNTYGAFLEGKKEFRRVNLYRAVSTCVYVGGMLITILLTDNLIWLIATYTITIFSATLFFYLHTKRSFPTHTPTAAQETIRYGRELTYIQLIDPITSQIDKIILGYFWGPAQLAVYALALTIPTKASMLIKSWVSIGLPKFSTKSPTEINTVLYKRILQGGTIGLVITVLYIFLSPYLFRYILPEYLDSILYSQWLALTFIFALPNRYMSLLFASQKLSRLLLRRSLIMSSIVIVLYVGFGLWGGLWGLVIANILSPIIGLVLNITMWHMFSKNYGIAL